jgi:hypothetical protein
MILPEHEMIFIHIPRTGGSSIEVAFGVGIEHRTPGYTYIGFPDKHKPPADYKAEDPEAWVNYFKFTVVRNPWDRIASVYRWLRICQNHPFYTELPFREWIFNMPSNTNATRPQAYWLDDDLDFIAKYENLIDDFHYICSRISLHVQVPHINHTRDKHYRAYYDRETRDRISALYEEDVRRFEYEF